MSTIPSLYPGPFEMVALCCLGVLTRHFFPGRGNFDQVWQENAHAHMHVPEKGQVRVC